MANPTQPRIGWNCSSMETNSNYLAFVALTLELKRAKSGARPVHSIRLTETHEIAPSPWVHPERIVDRGMGGRLGGIKSRLTTRRTGVHLWVDRFEGDLSDIFALQGQMTESVVSAIAPLLSKGDLVESGS